MNDFDYLADIYTLEQANFEVVKEDIRVRHLATIPGTTDEIITEGVSDFFSKMGEFFKKMIQSIKEFFKKFIMYINSMFMDIGKFVKKYKNELNNVSNVDFDIYGYEFTMHDKPSLEELEKIVNGYNSDISDVGSLKKAEIKKQQNEYLSHQNLCKLRGEVLGNKASIEEDDFMTEVRKYYRNGDDTDKSIHIGLSEFNEAVHSAEKDSKELKEAEKLRDDFITALSRAEKFFDQKVQIIYKDSKNTVRAHKVELKDNKFNQVKDDDAYASESKADVVEALVRYRYNQTRVLSSMVNIVVRERANAFKDKVKMDKEIIQKALFNKNTDSNMAENKDKED